MIRQGANFDDIDIDRDVYLRGDLFRVKLPGAGVGGKDAVATITAMAAAGNRLKFNCTACETICEHVGAAVSLVLEEKTAPGPGRPARREPAAGTAQRERTRRAGPRASARSGPDARSSASRSSDAGKPWTDYTVASALSGKTYRVALRGEERGQSYCSCPDFRTNTLGTCKHILHVLGPRAAAVSGGRAAEALSQPRGLRPRALRRRDDAAPATARHGPMPKWSGTRRPLADRPIDDVRRLVELPRPGWSGWAAT